jgi:hypothetical protein
MGVKKFVQIAAVAAVTMFVLGAFLHGVVKGQLVQDALAGQERERMIVPLVVLEYVVMGVFLTSLYARWERRDSPTREGLTLGLLTGLLWRFVHAIGEFGGFHVPVVPILVDAAVHVVEALAGGLAVALAWNAVVLGEPLARGAHGASAQGH